MVNINEEQITRLKTQAEQFGWVDSQQFKDKVNTQYWAGSYDKLVKNVAGSIQSWAIQGNMENANKIAPTPAPTEPVWTKIEPQTPVLPEATPIPTQTETVKTESITTPKPTNLWTIQGKNVMSEAPEFKGADWQTYKTVRFDDGSLGTVKVWEGWVNELVGNTYKDEQRADMKQIVEQGLNNADNIFNNLLRWQVLPEVVKTTNNYVKAQNRFNQYNQFKNLNQSQYQQLLAQGKLIPWTQAYNDLMNDPVAKSNIIKAQNLNAINQNQKAEEKIASTENNQSDVILSNNPTVAQALEDGSLSVEEYQALTNTPDITEKSKNVSKLKEEYIKLKSDYDAVEDDVNAELSGKWLSTSYINAKISERRKSLYKWLSLAEQLYSSAMWELTTMKKDATDLLETNLWLYKDRLKRNQELEDRQYQEDLATRTMQRQYDYTYGDINSTDPRIQNRAIQEAVKSMYEKYPIPGLESQSIKVQKIKDRIAQGMSGTQAIQEVENEIRNSNRYKQYLASEQAKMNPKETQDWAKLSDGTLYNQRTWETRSVSDITTGITDWWDEFFDKYSFIKKSEWFREQAYDDATGKTLAPGETPIWTATIWYGFTTLWGKPVKAGDTMTREQADGAMMQIADKYSTFKNKIKVPLSPQQEWALLSLEYNLWPGWKEYPAGKKIIEAINKWDFKTAANILATSWMGTTNAKTWEVMQWLVNRRKKEAELLLQWWTTWTSSITTVWQFLKDNQNRWAGYSEEDVKAFDAKIDRFIKNWDEKWMALAFRNNLLQDKDFKQEIDNVKKFQTGLSQVEKLISDYEKAGKSTNALKAMAEKVARATWLTTDEALAKMQTQMWFVMADYIKSISGTAASDAEVQRLMWNMASLWNVSWLNKTIISQVKANSQAGLESMVDTRMYGLPEDFKYKVFEDIYWNKSTTQNTWTSNENTYNNKNQSVKDLRKTYFDD